MPRYLGIDFLADALRQRKNMLSQMLLTIPSNLEYVDTYTHNGTASDRTRLIPRLKEMIPFKLSSRQPIDYLAQITEISGNIQRPVAYSSEKTGKDIVPSSNPDSPLVSFDMWSDLEEEIVDQVISSLAPDKEQFTPIDEKSDADSMKLEEVEFTDNLYSIRQKIPDINVLASRLKTKLVQDPLLLDSHGNPLEEKSLLRSEIQASFRGKNAEGQGQEDKEMFLKIHCGDNVNENEDEIEDVFSPEITSKDAFYVKETLRLLDLHEKNELVGEKPELLLQQPTHTGVETLTGSEESSELKTNDFVKLNEGDQTNACDVLEDQQLLESPSHLPTVAENHSSKKFISSLQPFKLSTEITSPPLSPNKVKQCVQNIWENEKFLLSEHIAMVLPVPTTSSRRRKDHSTTLIQEAMKKLTLSQELLDGKVELGIPWNPLAVSIRQMENCQIYLQSVSSWSDEKQSQSEISPHRKGTARETFSKNNIYDEAQDGSLSRDLQPFSGGKPKEQQSGEDGGKMQTLASKRDIHDTLSTLSTSSDTTTRFNSRSSNTSKFVTEVRDTSGETDEREPYFTKRTIIPALRQFSGGIDDFFLLREGHKNSSKSPSSGQCAPTKKVVKAAKVRPSVFTTEQTGFNSSETQDPTGYECHSQLHSNYPVRQRDIPVELSDDFQEILDELIGHVKPLLSKLQRAGVVPQTKTLSNLNPEYTRFVLKQTQMSLNEGEHKSDIYGMSICLHALVSSVDVLMHSGLEAAVAFFSSINEKYSSLIGGALESTRRYLFETRFAFEQQKIIHPKLSKLLTIVAKWSKDQEACSANAAIIVYTFHEKLTKEITETLSGLHGVQTRLFNKDTEINALQEENGQLVIYVVNGLAASEDFPWASFDFVLDYNPSGTVTREELSRSTRLKSHVILKTISKVSMGNHLSEAEDISDASLLSDQDQYIFIGSEKFTHNKDLLHLLETCHNVMIYERRRSKTKSEDSLNKVLLQPDVMIDERTCIHLQHLSSLTDENEYKGLRDVVLSLSLKCHKCHIIMYSNKQPDHAFTGEILRHLSLLFASCAHFQKNEFEVEILYSFTMKETARLIRQIGDKARAQSPVWNKMEWPKRKWLTNEASAHEEFLVSLPCMNSFSAQVMLTAAPLAELLKMSPEELKETCPWIPPKTLSEFYKSVNWCSELPVFSIAQPSLQTSSQSCFAVEPSPHQMPLAASEANSSPDSMVATRNALVESTDYRLNDPPSLWVNIQQTRETTRDPVTDRVYHTYSQDKPVTDDWSASAFGDRLNSFLDVSQRDEAEHHCPPFPDIPDTHDGEWRPLIARNTSSKSWKDNVESDLRRCITEKKVPYIRYDHQVTSNYPVKSHYFSEFPGSCRSRPEEISHLRDDNEHYLTHDEDIDVTGRSAMSLNFPIARGSTTHSSREQNDHFDSSWDRNVCGRRYQNPRDYRTHQIPQARVLDKDHSSKRVRQAVRVLDLGNEATRAVPTKVGIAQPQRRVYGSSDYPQVSVPSTSSQALRENTVASKHKRVSLGIERSTNSASKGAQQLRGGEHAVTAKRPSLDDPDKWSVFPSYLSSKRRKLTYEKIPGVESGQTKLVFKYDK
ncbi:protein shortage in chiasmata 1 ortholog-like [Pocillopora verrucosa]|uniref:protein shortage in chiasmata 1 ortholog-like n=1 Tax=Pocillopora verrucosa TaxID=203993 RepID=UPI0033417E9F